MGDSLTYAMDAIAFAGNAPEGGVTRKDVFWGDGTQYPFPFASLEYVGSGVDKKYTFNLPGDYTLTAMIQCAIELSRNCSGLSPSSELTAGFAWLALAKAVAPETIAL